MANDFEIRNGVLIKYNGKESHVIVPDGVVAIGNKAFTVTERVKRYREALPSMLAEWSNREYETIEYWEDETVSNDNLKKVTLPDSVLKIESCAFYKCSALESIELGKNICRIDWAAFQGCHNLGKVTVPDKAVIESYAFEKITEIIRVPKEEYIA